MIKTGFSTVKTLLHYVKRIISGNKLGRHYQDIAVLSQSEGPVTVYVHGPRAYLLRRKLIETLSNRPVYLNKQRALQASRYQDPDYHLYQIRVPEHAIIGHAQQLTLSPEYLQHLV